MISRIKQNIWGQGKNTVNVSGGIDLLPGIFTLTPNILYINGIFTLTPNISHCGQLVQ